MNNNSNAFRVGNETIFLINILNTMYNDNLRQINNLTETLTNLNNSNSQIRNLLVQLLNSNQGNRHSRRNQTDIFDTSDRNIGGYLIDEYTFPVNTNRQNNINETHDTLRDLRSVFEIFFQPIEIYPSQTQIEIATRRVRYCDITTPINTSCPISMDDFNDNDMVTVIRHCGHTFHSENIMNWFRSNSRCPVCRYDIRDYNIPNQNLNNSQDSSNNNIRLFDNNQTDSLTSFLINTLNRNRNTR
jgi:hypothetical protein